MSVGVLVDTDTLTAWHIAYPELQGVLTQDSRISIIYPDDDEAGRIESLAEERLNSAFPESRFLTYNLLSTQWTWARFHKNPIAYPFLYLAGMVTYALALPIRIAVFACAFFSWALGPLIYLCSGGSESLYQDMRKRTIVLLGALGEVMSGIVGIACPPLAYAMDEWIQSQATVHEWYSAYRFSLWSDDLEGPTIQEERIARKKEAVKEDIKHFKRARGELARRYLSEEREVSAMSPVSMELIVHFGFLDIFCSNCCMENSCETPLTLEDLKGTPLEHYCTHTLEACIDDSAKAKTREGLLGSINQFKKYWQACSQQELDPDLLSRAIKSVFILNAGAPVTYHSNETENDLQTALHSIEKMRVSVDSKIITGREAIDAIVDAIRRFSNTIKSTDREMEGVIVRNVYEE